MLCRERAEPGSSQHLLSPLQSPAGLPHRNPTPGAPHKGTKAAASPSPIPPRTDLLELVGEVEEGDGHADGLQEHGGGQHGPEGLPGAEAGCGQHHGRARIARGSTEPGPRPPLPGGAGGRRGRARSHRPAPAPHSPAGYTRRPAGSSCLRPWSPPLEVFEAGTGGARWLSAGFWDLLQTPTEG